MRCEAEFLYLGGRAQLRPADRARMEALLGADGFDWEDALGLAAFHGVLPLLGSNLAVLEGVPASILERVREWMKENATANLLKFSELIRIDRLFAEQGVSTVHFKGPVLAAHAFRNLALRKFFDIDVLIHESDARKARALLLANGYSSTLSPEGEELHLRTSYWLGFVHDTSPNKVDLHWKLADPFFRYEPDLPTLWANVQTLQLAGAEIRTFGPEDSVLVLAAHGFKHGYSRLKWVCDLCEWIRVHPELDWDSIVAAARSLHVHRILSVSLLLVHELDDEVLPAGLAAQCAVDAKAVALKQRVWERIFDGRGALEGWRGEWFHAKGRERTGDAIHYLWHQCVRRFKKVFVPNEKDRAMVRLPTGLGFLYYALRPFRLGWKVVSRKRSRTESPDAGSD